MDITIIGTGNMARGHAVTLLGTTEDKAQTLAAELPGNVDTGTVGDPLCDAVVLAVWYAAVGEVLGRYGSQLDGKILVDISNPLDVDAFEPITVEAGSGAQQTASAAPGARVVKVFNTTFAGTLLEGQVAGQPLDVFIASDDEEAKVTVSRLALRRRTATGRRRATQARPRARGARLPPHGSPAEPRQRIRSTIKVLA